MTHEKANPASILRDRQVANYFLGVLASSLPIESKYHRFIEFFDREFAIHQQIEDRLGQKSAGEAESMGRILLEVSRDLKLWNPSKLLLDVKEGIARAIVWLCANQNQDGGWGYKPDSGSVFWETAFSAICLDSVGKLGDEAFADLEIEDTLGRACEWLGVHLDGWAFDYCPKGETLNTYNVALAILCCYTLGKDRFAQAFVNKVGPAIDRLAGSRCADGGWGCRDWSKKAKNLIAESRSEVGATSLAVRALSKAANPAHLPTIDQALRWMLQFQNSEGSWSDAFQGSQPSIPKTCDAIEALLAGQDLGIKIDSACLAIDRAIAWLQSQECVILDDGTIRGWGWDAVPKEIKEIDSDDYSILQSIFEGKSGEEDRALADSGYVKTEGKYLLREGLDANEKDRLMQLLLRRGIRYDYISTCLTLEALVKMPDAFLPMLRVNAVWLLENQCLLEGVKTYGMWGKNTARITASLIEFYSRLKNVCISIHPDGERIGEGVVAAGPA
ncbi:hypothetical protein MTYM_02214 [Methylococcales bacterium]|nr:hypothetical protein MTYM_02214 [Methylococcales bacterium]